MVMETAPGIDDDLVDTLREALETGILTRGQADGLRDALDVYYAAFEPPPGTRHGYVNKWDAGKPYGFITCTDPGEPRAWFVHKRSLAGGDYLNRGTRVLFEGDPDAMPGREFPTARRVEAR